MPNGGKKREKLVEDLNGAGLDEVFESEDFIDEDEKVIGKFPPKRCVPGSRKRRPPSDYSPSKMSISVDGNPYAENNPEEFDRRRNHVSGLRNDLYFYQFLIGAFYFNIK